MLSEFCIRPVTLIRYFAATENKLEKVLMYPRPKFLEILIEIREEMAREADFDVDLFVENVRSGRHVAKGIKHSMADAGKGNGQPLSPRRTRTKKK